MFSEPLLLSQKINYWNKKLVGCLMIILVLDVWIGIVDRYLLHWQLSWVEELARYIMIWTILMAVPCAMAQREHISLELLTSRLSTSLLKPLGFITDLIIMLFFLYIAYAGLTFTGKGWSQASTVFGMPMAVAYAAIPVAFGLTAFQVLLLMLGRDRTQMINEEVA